MPTLARIALAAIMLAGINAAADQGSFFFDSEASAPRPKALFDDAQRQRLLQAAHACSGAEKPPDEQRQCDAWERQTRDSVASRTRQLHQQAEPQRAELRFLHQQQRGR